MLLGDLNVNLLPNSKSHSGDKQKFLNFIRKMDLNQLIKEPTRISNTTRSLIDIILVNNEHRIVNCGVVPMALSDHSLVFCVLKAGVVKAQPRIIEYRSYKQFDINAFIKDLENVPWHIIENEQNVNDALFTWNKLFTDIVDEHAPIKKRRVKGVPLPWMNNKLSEMMKDRDYHHRKAIKSSCTYQWQLYKRLRNLVNREVKLAKSTYYCNLIQEAQGNASGLWKAVNEASSRNQKSSVPQCIITDGVQHSTPKSIASTLNSFFASIGKVLADRIVTLNVPSERVTSSVDTSFHLLELQESTVLQKLLSLKPNKAIGLDKISARLLKHAAHTIYPSVTKLLNLSIRSSTFPDL